MAESPDDEPPSAGPSPLERLLESAREPFLEWTDARSLTPALRRLQDHEAVRLLLVGAAIGVAAGVAAGAFDFVTVNVSRLVLGTPEPSVGGVSWWRALLGPVLTALIAFNLIRLSASRGRPQGVQDVILRTQLDQSKVSLRDGVLTATGAALSVGGGLSGGREGPIVQLSSALSDFLCRQLGVRPNRMRALVAAGAAAGIAASFNTPLGGAFFALELILGNFAVDTFAPVVVATVMGTVVGQALLGDRVALHLPAFGLRSVLELPFYVLLGALAAGLGAVVKQAATAVSQHLVLPERWPHWLHAAPMAAAVGLLAALGLNPIMGNGYAYMEALLRGEVTPSAWFLLALLVVKVAATALSFRCNTGSGLFAPSLFVGAVAGMLVGHVVHALIPGSAEDPGAYGMVGMGAVAASVLNAPITMSLMLFEMSGNYHVMLPLLLTLATSSLVSSALGSRSIYEMTLLRLGVNLDEHRDKTVLQKLRVADVMRRTGFERIRSDAPIDALLERFLARRTDEVFVVDPDGRFSRTVDIHDVKDTLGEHADGLVRDLRTRPPAIVRADQSLAHTLPVFFDHHAEQLPVVDASGVLVGVITQRDVVAAYHREVLRKDARLARVVCEDDEAGERHTDFVELPRGYRVEMIEASNGLVGQSLRDLALPQRHGCTVVAVSVWDAERGEYDRVAPDPGYVLADGDRLILIGPASDLAELRADGES